MTTSTTKWTTKSISPTVGQACWPRVYLRASFVSSAAIAAERYIISHITGVSNTVIITNLLALKQAIEQYCPTMEFVKGENHYHTWKDYHNGKLAGDWPLPDGWTEEDVGENAAHILRLKEEHLNGRGRTGGRSPHEIGIVPVKVTRDAAGKVLKAVPCKGSKEYILMVDWWANGNGVLKEQGIGTRVTDSQTKQESAFGELYMYFRMMEAKQQAEKQGDSIKFEQVEDGTFQAIIDTSARLGA